MFLAADLFQMLIGLGCQINNSLLPDPGVLFHCRRHHRRKHLPQWTDIVLTDPFGQFHQLLVQQRHLIQDRLNGFQLKPLTLSNLVGIGNDTHHKRLLKLVGPAERHLHPLPWLNRPHEFRQDIIKQRIRPRIQRNTHNQPRHSRCAVQLPPKQTFCPVFWHNVTRHSAGSFNWERGRPARTM